MKRRATRPAGPPGPSYPARRPDAELRKLAREVIQGLAMVTNDEHKIRCAFYIMTTMMDWRQVDATKVAALIGYTDSVVPGRAMNGYPIFLSMGFLHVDDVAAYDAHLAQMEAALQ